MKRVVLGPVSYTKDHIQTGKFRRGTLLECSGRGSALSTQKDSQALEHTNKMHAVSFQEYILRFFTAESGMK